jgi:hypothetical protein
MAHPERSYLQRGWGGGKGYACNALKMDKTSLYILVIALVLALSIGTKEYMEASKSSGAEAVPVKTHNPGDLEWDGNTKWLGQTGTYTTPAGRVFVVFDTDEHGARACTITAINYFKNDGVVTLRDFGNRWAPASDNEGDSSYGPNLASRMNLSPDDPFDYSNIGNLQALMKGIFTNEDSSNPVDTDSVTIAQAVNDAIQETGLSTNGNS